MTIAEAADIIENLGETQNRRYSTVERAVLNGKVAYIKCYKPGAWGADAGVVAARVAREADVIVRVEQSGLFPARFGTMHLICVDPAQARIVTQEASGSPLDERLIAASRRVNHRESLTALFLAGRWLRQFQSLETNPGDAVQISPTDPDDLLEYCRLRMRTISKLGYSWLDRNRQARLEQKLAELLARTAPEEKGHVWGHGDYHLGNMLWDGRRLTVIDFAMSTLRVPLADVASFFHRLDLIGVYTPWKRRPIVAWKRAFLRGYGRLDAVDSPMFQAQMIRYWLCRLQSFVRRPAHNAKDRVHHTWIRRCARKRLAAAVN